MKKKIFIAMIILSILGIICLNYTKSEAYTHSGSVRQFIGKSYTDLNGYSFGDFSTEAWLYNSDDGVICVHDGAYADSASWCSKHGKYCTNCHYQLDKSFSGYYYYYDKIRLTFDNTKYINSFEDLYNELDDNKYKYFGYTSFQKKEWTLILNDLIQIYPDIEFI